MSPVQTLFEFTNGIVSDPQALSDFQADPTGVLNAAGLGDVTAADVHDVIPLVLDFAPAPVAEQFDQLADLGQADQLSMVTGTLSGAVDQLQQFAGQFSAATNAVDSAQTTVGGVTAPVLDTVEANTPKLLPTTDNTVNTVTTDLGVHPVVDNATASLNSTVHQVSGTVDGLLGNLPVAGPLVTAGMTDLSNAVGGVAANEANGTLVGSAADAVSNHLLDSALVSTLNTTLDQHAPALGGLVSNVEHSLAGPLGTVNTALGSTPVHPAAGPTGNVIGDSLHAVAPQVSHVLPGANVLPTVGHVTAPVTGALHATVLPTVQHTVTNATTVVDHGVVGETVHQVTDTAHLNIAGDALSHLATEPTHLLGAHGHELPLGL